MASSTHEKEWGRSPRSFSKIGKKCPNLLRKCPDCGHQWVKFSIKNAIFKSFQAKKMEIFFPARPFFLVLQVNVYRSALIPRTLPCPKKFLVTRLYLHLLIQTYSLFILLYELDKIVKTQGTQKLQKQPREALFKKRCSEKFRKIHWKTPDPENFFKKILQRRGVFL